jgi:hypothetical protein
MDTTSEARSVSGRGVLIALGTAVAAALVAGLGIRLFFSAPTDDAARSNLGVGLLTGLLTSLVWVSRSSTWNMSWSVVERPMNSGTATLRATTSGFTP